MKKNSLIILFLLWSGGGIHAQNSIRDPFDSEDYKKLVNQKFSRPDNIQERIQLMEKYSRENMQILQYFAQTPAEAIARNSALNQERKKIKNERARIRAQKNTLQRKTQSQIYLSTIHSFNNKAEQNARTFWVYKRVARRFDAFLDSTSSHIDNSEDLFFSVTQWLSFDKINKYKYKELKKAFESKKGLLEYAKKAEPSLLEGQKKYEFLLTEMPVDTLTIFPDDTLSHEELTKAIQKDSLQIIQMHKVGQGMWAQWDMHTSFDQNTYLFSTQSEGIDDIGNCASYTVDRALINDIVWQLGSVFRLGHRKFEINQDTSAPPLIIAILGKTDGRGYKGGNTYSHDLPNNTKAMEFIYSNNNGFYALPATRYDREDKTDLYRTYVTYPSKNGSTKANALQNSRGLGLCRAFKYYKEIREQLQQLAPICPSCVANIYFQVSTCYSLNSEDSARGVDLCIGSLKYLEEKQDLPNQETSNRKSRRQMLKSLSKSQINYSKNPYLIPYTLK